LGLFELGLVGVKRKGLARDLPVLSGHAHLDESECAAGLFLAAQMRSS
jgi:hypothetical protein